MAEHTIGEEWRPVVGYEGYYEISSIGRIRSAGLGRGIAAGRIKKPKVVNGYLATYLRKNGTRKWFKVHRLVLCAFVGPRPTDKHECNHINGVRDDNRVENLEWVTRYENMQHAKNVLKSIKTRRGEDSCRAKLTEKKVREIRERKSRGETYPALAKCYGVGENAIYRIVKRHKWKHVQ